jgi:hypothetical protein
MKKLIGTVSFVLVMGCALALANANDNANANNGTSDMNSAPNAMSHQEPGTAADTNTDAVAPDSSDKMKSESTTTTTTSKSAMNKKSCTDENGKVIKSGHTGFTACMKAHAKDQMGGTVDDSVNKIDKSMDTHDTSGSSN